MSEHVPNDLLADFVDGDVDPQLAVHIAEHLDQCVHCATRAVSLEPLASAFASCDDPAVPEGLTTAILAELAQRPAERPRVPEVAVGIGLMGLGAALAAATQHPVTLLADAGALFAATEALIRGAASGLGPYAAASSLAMLGAGAGAALTLRAARAPGIERELEHLR